MKYTLKVDKYFIFVFVNSFAFMRKIRIYCFCKNSIFLITAVFFNFLVVPIGHWLKFEFSTIFRKRGCLVRFEDLVVFLQKRNSFCLEQFENFFKRRKFWAKDVGLVLYHSWNKRSSQVKPFP